MTTDERPYSLKRGAQGCLAAWGVLTVCIVVVSGVVYFMDKDYDRVKNYVALVSWPIAMCVGGYYACKKGKTTGTTNAMVTGILGEIVLLSAMSVRGMTATDQIRAALLDPGKHWIGIALAILTVPCAWLGGSLWARTSRNS